MNPSSMLEFAARKRDRIFCGLGTPPLTPGVKHSPAHSRPSTLKNVIMKEGWHTMICFLDDRDSSMFDAFLNGYRRAWRTHISRWISTESVVAVTVTNHDELTVNGTHRMEATICVWGINSFAHGSGLFSNEGFFVLCKVNNTLLPSSPLIRVGKDSDVPSVPSTDISYLLNSRQFKNSALPRRCLYSTSSFKLQASRWVIVWCPLFCFHGKEVCLSQ